jgi:hypothetical protein
MGRAGFSRAGTAQPSSPGSNRRSHGEGRLDPVRWRRPGRGVLMRLAAVAVLLATAAAVSWSPAQSCAPRTGAAAASPVTSHTAAAPTSHAGTQTNDTQTTSPPTVPDGSVGVPVRLADPTALTLVRPGNHVDLLRLDQHGGSKAVASAALVLSVTGATDPASGGLLLALSPAEARAAVTSSPAGFAVLIRPG